MRKKGVYDKIPFLSGFLEIFNQKDDKTAFTTLMANSKIINLVNASKKI
jgi:hypothetical protein